MKQKRELKAYGGLVYRKGRQIRAVVAAYSQSDLAKLIGESLYHVRTWWHVAGNKDDIRKAMKKPRRIILVRDY